MFPVVRNAANMDTLRLNVYRSPVSALYVQKTIQPRSAQLRDTRTGNVEHAKIAGFMLTTHLERVSVEHWRSTLLASEIKLIIRNNSLIWI